MPKALTKDELFMLKLYELALEGGHIYQEIDRYAIGRLIGQNDKGIDTIVKHLAQANFVKKGEDKAIFLTSNGIELVDQLSSGRIKGK